MTAEMYEAAYADLRQCMRDHGTGLAGRVHGRSRARILLSQLDESVYAVCYADFEQIDFAWQIAHTYDSPTYVALRKCLTDIGVTPASDAEGVYQQILDNGIDPDHLPTTCRQPLQSAVGVNGTPAASLDPPPRTFRRDPSHGT